MASLDDLKPVRLNQKTALAALADEIQTMRDALLVKEREFAAKERELAVTDEAILAEFDK